MNMLLITYAGPALEARFVDLLVNKGPVSDVEETRAVCET